MDRKTIIITGAANGIGKAIAQLFAKEGWFVGAFDLDEKGLTVLKKELGAKNCFTHACDISTEESVATAVSEFAKVTDGRLDVLVANAGILFQGNFEKYTVAQYKKQIEVNAFGTVNTIYQSLDLLKKTPGSRIVITSSSSALYGIPNFAVYSSTKGFLRNLTEALSTEFAHFDIKISDVMPLFVSTSMMDGIEKKYKANHTADDVAKVVYKAGTTGRKRHYLMGGQLKILSFLGRFLPIKTVEKIIKSNLKIKY